MTRAAVEVIPEGSAAEAFVYDELASLGVETMTFEVDENATYDLIKALTKAAGPKGFEVTTVPKGQATEVRVARKRPTQHRFVQERCPIAYHDRLKSDPTLFRAETHPGGHRSDDAERFELGHCKRCGGTLELATRKNGRCQACGKSRYFCECRSGR